MRVVIVIVVILITVILASTISCLRAAGRADKWSEEIMRKEFMSGLMDEHYKR